MGCSTSTCCWRGRTRRWRRSWSSCAVKRRRRLGGASLITTLRRGNVQWIPRLLRRSFLQLEISRLHGENERLQQENSRIKSLSGRLQEDHDSSSSESSSSSSSSSSSDSSSSSEDENEDESSPDCKKSNAGQGRPEDTGYESTASKEPTPPL